MKEYELHPQEWKSNSERILKLLEPSVKCIQIINTDRFSKSVFYGKLFLQMLLSKRVL